MRALRRALFAQATAWLLAGFALALIPGFVTGRLFGGPPHQEVAWVRLLGVQCVGLAMFMVLVANRAEQVWWWAWGFALVSVATSVLLLLNSAFGLGPHQSAAWWWVAALVATGLSLLLLYGMAAAGREQPFPG